MTEQLVWHVGSLVDVVPSFSKQRLNFPQHVPTNEHQAACRVWKAACGRQHVALTEVHSHQIWPCCLK
eukprot:1157446-Pelagomonas_calceolata.AAC.8